MSDNQLKRLVAEALSHLKYNRRSEAAGTLIAECILSASERGISIDVIKRVLPALANEVDVSIA